MSGTSRQTGHVNVGARARIGQWALGAEGFAMGVFGGAGLAWSMANPHFGAAGAPIILETPADGLADDVAYLKEALA